jgi:pimeloyl-ACP methyl ester carboxylesterase
MVEIFVGGAFDGTFQPVRGYYNKYLADHPTARYFSHDAPDAIRDALAGVPDAEPINLIGHSWGGDTAAYIAARYRRKINILITVDPVGHNWLGEVPPPEDDYPHPGRPRSVDYTSFFMMIRAGCDKWVDVDAVPEAWYHGSNLVAGIGGYWGADVKDIAHVYIPAPYDHGEFTKLLRSGKNGLSAESILTAGR